MLTPFFTPRRTSTFPSFLLPSLSQSPFFPHSFVASLRHQCASPPSLAFPSLPLLYPTLLWPACMGVARFLPAANTIMLPSSTKTLPLLSPPVASRMLVLLGLTLDCTHFVSFSAVAHSNIRLGSGACGQTNVPSDFVSSVCATITYLDRY